MLRDCLAKSCKGKHTMWKICSSWHNQTELEINLEQKNLRVCGSPLMEKRENGH